jgi:hypothetical protein
VFTSVEAPIVGKMFWKDPIIALIQFDNIINTWRKEGKIIEVKINGKKNDYLV